MIKQDFYNDEFEQLLKENADQFSMYPSRRVWHSIYNNLHPGRRWPSVVISLLFISSLILIGYLNTGENSITRQINSSTPGIIAAEKSVQEKNTPPVTGQHNQALADYKTGKPSETTYNNAFDDVMTNAADFYTYTVVKSNRPVYLYSTAVPTPEITLTPETSALNNIEPDIIQTVSNYIKSNRIFADIAVFSKKNKNNASKSGDNIPKTGNEADLSTTALGNTQKPITPAVDNIITETAKETNTPAALTSKNEADKHMISNADKAWMENYAMQNKPAAKKWKGRLGYQFYVTPAVNYRKLTTKAKGSTAPFATADINNVISQKPGFGFEAGLGLNYAVAKRLQLKAGLQFNYTNYNIDADRASHPLITTILLNDPSTGYSYTAARTSTTSNKYNSSASSPITLHNRTYQVSVPIGFGYKISSKDNVEWFAGASVQPTYYFGGKAHLISSDLQSYVSEPSSISSWNLNLGFETYMNFKMGTYNLQVGPQVRYQVNSTYRRDVALIEKPYAVGLRFGLTKGF